eukprot:2733315-Amphidinium_carterae.1
MSWAVTIASSVLSLYLSRQPQVCRCLVESSVDSGLLSVLEKQLDRCGPENLRSTEGSAGFWPGVLTGALLTVIAGLCIRLLCDRVVRPKIDRDPDQTVKVRDLGQVLIDFFHDQNYQWHHRLLLARLENARWVAATPDEEIEIVNLSDHRVIPLGRSAQFPARVAGNAYCFDPLPLGGEDDLMKRGLDLARVMGFSPEDTRVVKSRESWRVSDPGLKSFAERVEPGVVSDPARAITRGRVGLFLVEEVWITGELVEDSKAEQWAETKRSGPGRDLRLAGVARDGAGR